MSSLGDFYSLCPKDFARNLAFRKNLIRASAGDLSVKQDIWAMCSRDILFWVNSFVFTKDPRKDSAVLPFITYDFQDEGLLSIEKSIGHCDIIIEKSRCVGASWMCLLAILHQWLFREDRDFLLVSSKEDLVDARGNPSSLMWKLDFILDRLPGWMRPSYTRASLKFVNNDNKSTITGESTHKNVGRGGRNTAILLDEFAQVEQDTEVLEATQANTYCRIFNSTPNYRGTNCRFYDMTLRPGIQKLRFHWSQHPEFSEGLYVDAAGKPRSPWYDRECERSVSPAQIATQLDIDYHGAASGFFDQTLIDRLREAAFPPIMLGEIGFEEKATNPHFLDVSNGKWRFWEKPDVEEKWQSEYAIGADISYGKGSTNSTLSVVDKKTGRKVAAAKSAYIEPHKWAEVAVAAARWFNNAYLIWEANGPGRIFGDNVAELGYRHFYFRRKVQTLSKDSTEVYGWQNNQGGLVDLFGVYQKALRTGTFTNPDIDSLSECLQYSFNKNGNIQHGGAANAADPSGARDNHGDMVVADALACKAISESPCYERPEEKAGFPEYSFGWRMEQAEKRNRLLTSGIVWVA